MEVVAGDPLEDPVEAKIGRKKSGHDQIPLAPLAS